MHIIGLISLLTLLCSAPTAVLAQTITPQSNQSLHFDSLLDRAQEQGQNDDMAGMADTLREVIAHPQFADMTAEGRYATFYYLSFALMRQADYQGAYDRLIQAGTMSPSSKDAAYWQRMTTLCFLLHREEDGFDALLKLGADYPDTLKGLDSDFLASVLRRANLLDDNEDRHMRLLEALLHVGYVPNDPFASTERYSFALFEIYVRKGEIEKARKLTKDLHKPGTLLRLTIDNRYAPYRGDVASLDLAAALKKETEHDRALMAANPRLIEGVTNYVGSLISARQAQEGLNLLDKALKKATRTTGKPAFDDLDEQLQWAYDQRNNLLQTLGRWDEAEIAMVKARDTALKAGNDVVSQSLNLGAFYYQTGKPEKALELVANVDLETASSYGFMVAQGVRACAYAQTGQKEEMSAALDYLKSQIKDGYGPLRNALLCANDIEGLATLTVSRLDDPLTRTSTLIDLQTYLPQEHSSPFDRTLDLRNVQMIARPEVQAAARKYGVIISVPW